jgi:hypothetical protein
MKGGGWGAPVEALQNVPFKGLVYNFEVENLHCYTVGLNNVLVHNNNGQEVNRGACSR